MSARVKRLPPGTPRSALDAFSGRPAATKLFLTVAEERVAIAALFRAGFSLLRIAVILTLPPGRVEIELREYLLAARP